MKLALTVCASLVCTGLARAGDESLLPLRTWTTNIWMVELAAADFDGNGHREIVSFNSDEGPTSMDVFSLGPHGDMLAHMIQSWFADGSGPSGFTASNALTAVTP